MTTTAELSSSSLLSDVAKHERTLLAKVEAVEQEARSIVDQARVQAQRHLQAEAERLAQDVATMRKDAESKRQAAFDATLRAAEERLASVRQDAAARVPDMAKRVLGMFMPGNTGE